MVFNDQEMDYYMVLDQIKYEMDSTSENIPLLENMIQAADADNNIDISIEARELLIEHSIFWGYPKKALQAFSWLVKQFEQNEVHINYFNLLWQYKWITESIAEFHEISLPQMEQLFTDMEVKYQSLNYSLAPYYKTKTLNAMQRGDKEIAKENFIKWQNTPTDFLNDCAACEAHEIAHYYAFIGNYEQAIKTARPIVEGRTLTCAEIPGLTYGLMATVNLKVGEAKKAENCYKKGIKVLKHNPALFEGLAGLIEYLVGVNRPNEALQLFEEHRAEVLKAEGSLAGLRMLISIYPVLEDISLKDITVSLAKKFDDRNQNNYYMSQLYK